MTTRDLREVSAKGKKGFPFHRKPVEAYANYIDYKVMNMANRVGAGKSDLFKTTAATIAGDSAEGQWSKHDLCMLPVESIITGGQLEVITEFAHDNPILDFALVVDEEDKGLMRIGSVGSGSRTTGLFLYADTMSVTIPEIPDQTLTVTEGTGSNPTTAAYVGIDSSSANVSVTTSSNKPLRFPNGGMLKLAIKRTEAISGVSPDFTAGELFVTVQFIEVTRKNLLLFETDETAQDKRYGSRQDT